MARAQARGVEHYAQQLREAAGVLQATARGVADDGRLHSLLLLRDQAIELDRQLAALRLAMEELRVEAEFSPHHLPPTPPR